MGLFLTFTRHNVWRVLQFFLHFFCTFKQRTEWSEGRISNKSAWNGDKPTGLGVCVIWDFLSDIFTLGFSISALHFTLIQFLLYATRAAPEVHLLFFFLLCPRKRYETRYVYFILFLGLFSMSVMINLFCLIISMIQTPCYISVNLQRKE